MTSRPLHESTDELNEEIEALQQVLAAKGYGVRFSLVLPPTRNGREVLSFTRLGEQRHWCFAYETEHAHDDNATINPLVSLSRRKRLELVEHLPKLIAGIDETVRAEQDRVDKAISVVRDVRRLLEGGL
jgi:hypothetical protein